MQEEVCHRAMVTKALDQLMALLNPNKAFLGRKQVNLIAEKRPASFNEFKTMSLHGLSHNMRDTHGTHIIETLKQASSSQQQACVLFTQACVASWQASTRTSSKHAVSCEQAGS